ncbi:MAG: DUF357 domain-containing protein [Candidatus Thermoplasmatota archaeon]|jgi:hypothetical protein|uniref:DUF357 domain-containing protein n=1 Tax=Ferroplasma sp. TaxID=2591003 RepID=UPI00261FD2D7|nr:DUF357 domain-containing protein [Ferroplasma sp.]MCL4311750.1 DUF357 domain-containing protein [Candidatus Thermoplasmatota archaeon]
MELKEKVEKYFEIEKAALDKIRITAPQDSYIYGIAKDHMEMILSYYNDAKYFYDKNDFINAFAALNYSYGWIDSAIRIGLFDGDSDHRLFTHFR